MSLTRAAASSAGDAEPIAERGFDRAVLARILSYVWPQRVRLGFALLCLPLATLFEILQPYLLKRAIDDHIARGQLDGLDRLGLAYLCALGAQYLVLFAETYLLQSAGQEAMAGLRATVYHHTLSLSQAFFDRTPVGRLLTRMTSDIEALSEMFAAGLVSLLADAVKVALIVIAMVSLDLHLALVSLMSAPILYAIAWLFRRIVRDAFRQIRTASTRLNIFLQEHLSGLRVIQAFAREAHIFNRFEVHNRAYRTASTRAIAADAALYAIVEAVGAFAVAFLLWHGGARIYAGTISLGVLVAFIEYLHKLFAPIRDLSTKFTVMQQAMASSERIFELLDERDLDAPPVAAQPTPGSTPATGNHTSERICFEHVSFAYRPGAFVLNDVSFAIARGETVAIVGPSGAGKSTLVKLILRFFDPTHGRVLLDGVDVRQVPATRLRSMVVLVPQDLFLFSGTLDEAVGLGRASPEATRAALARVGLERLTARRAEGNYGPEVSERGANFSSGERQLLALARAFVCDPEILILDEATANVDPESEHRIEASIAQLVRGRTSLVIAHRFSTIARADRILVMDGGRIVESGRYDDLVAQGGLFARLHALQQIGGLQPGVRRQESPP